MEEEGGRRRAGGRRRRVETGAVRAKHRQISGRVAVTKTVSGIRTSPGTFPSQEVSLPDSIPRCHLPGGEGDLDRRF